jgi:hypothetical protein
MVSCFVSMANITDIVYSGISLIILLFFIRFVHMILSRYFFPINKVIFQFIIINKPFAVVFTALTKAFRVSANGILYPHLTLLIMILLPVKFRCLLHMAEVVPMIFSKTTFERRFWAITSLCSSSTSVTSSVLWIWLSILETL